MDDDIPLVYTRGKGASHRRRRAVSSDSDGDAGGAPRSSAATAAAAAAAAAAKHRVGLAPTVIAAEGTDALKDVTNSHQPVAGSVEQLLHPTSPGRPGLLELVQKLKADQNFGARPAAAAGNPHAASGSGRPAAMHTPGAALSPSASAAASPGADCEQPLTFARSVKPRRHRTRVVSDDSGGSTPAGAGAMQPRSMHAFDGTHTGPAQEQAGACTPPPACSHSPPTALPNLGAAVAAPAFSPASPAADVANCFIGAAIDPSVLATPPGGHSVSSASASFTSAHSQGAPYSEGTPRLSPVAGSPRGSPPCDEAAGSASIGAVLPGSELAGAWAAMSSPSVGASMASAVSAECSSGSGSGRQEASLPAAAGATPGEVAGSGWSRQATAPPDEVDAGTLALAKVPRRRRRKSAAVVEDSSASSSEGGSAVCSGSGSKGESSAEAPGSRSSGRGQNDPLGHNALQDLMQERLAQQLAQMDLAEAAAGTAARGGEPVSPAQGSGAGDPRVGGSDDSEGEAFFTPAPRRWRGQGSRAVVIVSDDSSSSAGEEGEGRLGVQGGARPQRDPYEVPSTPSPVPLSRLAVTAVKPPARGRAPGCGAGAGVGAPPGTAPPGARGKPKGRRVVFAESEEGLSSGSKGGSSPELQRRQGQRLDDQDVGSSGAEELSGVLSGLVLQPRGGHHPRSGKRTGPAAHTPMRLPGAAGGLASPGRGSGVNGLGGGVGKTPARGTAAKTQSPGTVLKGFLRTRKQLSEQLYARWNELVFGGRLPKDLPLVWRRALTSTAGQVVDDRPAAMRAGRPEGELVPQRLELSENLLVDLKRLRNTLSHEMCHVAAWTIDREFKQHHGAAFKRWARRFMDLEPDITINRLHDYGQDMPHRWECVRCHTVYTRSRMIIKEMHRCSKCGDNGHLNYLGKFNAQGKRVDDPTATPRAASQRKPSMYLQFCRDMLPKVKRALPAGTPQREVMQEVARRWHQHKERRPSSSGGGAAGSSDRVSPRVASPRRPRAPSPPRGTPATPRLGRPFAAPGGGGGGGGSSSRVRSAADNTAPPPADQSPEAGAADANRTPGVPVSGGSEGGGSGPEAGAAPRSKGSGRRRGRPRRASAEQPTGEDEGVGMGSSLQRLFFDLTLDE